MVSEKRERINISGMFIRPYFLPAIAGREFEGIYGVAIQGERRGSQFVVAFIV